MPAILFVCTANQFRSPLAAASLQGYILNSGESAGWKVESAGTWTTDGKPALPVTRQNAERLGLSGIEKHSSRQVKAEMLNFFDLIIVMEAGQKEALNVEFRDVRGRIYMLSEIVGNESVDVPDPIVLGTPADEVATELDKTVRIGANKILELARALSNKRKSS